MLLIGMFESDPNQNRVAFACRKHIGEMFNLNIGKIYSSLEENTTFVIGLVLCVKKKRFNLPASSFKVKVLFMMACRYIDVDG